MTVSDNATELNQAFIFTPNPFFSSDTNTQHASEVLYVGRMVQLAANSDYETSVDTWVFHTSSTPMCCRNLTVKLLVPSPHPGRVEWAEKRLLIMNPISALPGRHTAVCSALGHLPKKSSSRITIIVAKMSKKKPQPITPYLFVLSMSVFQRRPTTPQPSSVQYDKDREKAHLIEQKASIYSHCLLPL